MSAQLHHGDELPAVNRDAMRVLVTGGTGVLGSAAIPELLARGWEVLVASRPDQRAQPTGATPVSVSIFDRDALVRVLAGVDAVLHLATRIPRGSSAVDPAAWRSNDDLRAVATEVLVDAALAANVTAFVYPSVSFVYADGGAHWLRAGAPVDPTPVLRSTLVAERELARFAAHPGRRGVAVRLGGLYGPSSSLTRAALSSAARGHGPVAGPADAYTPALWDSDAATALVAAIDAPSGVYDVVDDDPLPRSEVNRLYLAAVGTSVERALPDSGGELTRTALAFLLRSHRVSNSSFREVTGWRPSMPSVADAVSALGSIADQPQIPSPDGATPLSTSTTTKE